MPYTSDAAITRFRLYSSTIHYEIATAAKSQGGGQCSESLTVLLILVQSWATMTQFGGIAERDLRNCRGRDRLGSWASSVELAQPLPLRIGQISTSHTHSSTNQTAGRAL